MISFNCLGAKFFLCDLQQCRKETLSYKYSKLTLEEARGLEQYYIEEYHALNAYNKMNNQMNGISPLNKKIQIYMNATMNKLANRLENVILNLTVG